METTIAVKETTAQLLSRLKERFKARSVDETIMKIIEKSEKITKSRFGSQSKLKEFTRKERALSHEL